MKTYRITVNGEVFAVTVEEAQTPTPGTGLPRVVAPAPAAAPVSPTLPSVSPKTASAPPVAAPKPVVSPGGRAVQAPMPGKVIAVKVAPGDVVKSGALLLILEAMKMENDIMAPIDGTVTAVHVKEGDSVSTGAVLVVMN